LPGISTGAAEKAFPASLGHAVYTRPLELLELELELELLELELDVELELLELELLELELPEDELLELLDEV